VASSTHPNVQAVFRRRPSRKEWSPGSSRVVPGKSQGRSLLLDDGAIVEPISTLSAFQRHARVSCSVYLPILPARRYLSGDLDHPVLPLRCRYVAAARRSFVPMASGVDVDQTRKGVLPVPSGKDSAALVNPSIIRAVRWIATYAGATGARAPLSMPPLRMTVTRKGSPWIGDAVTDFCHHLHLLEY